MTQFKQLKDMDILGMIGLKYRENSGHLYDGLIHNGFVEKKLKLDQFICPRCKESQCFVCPDATNGKTYLSCSHKECMWENAEFIKKVGRKRFQESLTEF